MLRSCSGKLAFSPAVKFSRSRDFPRPPANVTLKSARPTPLGGKRSVKQLFVLYVALFFSGLTGSAYAADVDDFFSHSSAYNWTGVYGGFTAGAAFGQYDPRTSTTAGGYIGAPGAAAVTAAGTQTINALGFIAGIEGGYNWQIGNLCSVSKPMCKPPTFMARSISGAVHYPARRRQISRSRRSARPIGWRRCGRALASSRPIIGCSMPPAVSR